ncbi:hypothetical protein [Macrococcoides caseolyticum]|uniref:hypothetical protein n=1 Tax=Macrococcoides caseolyticum TaxID=69966 RepID=UPI001F33C328|nr:hypothetical protein [Macrococcus caseolyticus]MCE4956454.1 hypothetical protein [Macrococcus caseolyticus]
MFKNILLIILSLINFYFIFSITSDPSIHFLSFHVISAGFAFIISILFLITHITKMTKSLAWFTLLIAGVHIYFIVMVIYTYVYVK